MNCPLEADEHEDRLDEHERQLEAARAELRELRRDVARIAQQNERLHDIATLKDGGVGQAVKTSPGCLRRPIGDLTCLKRDGGDPGGLNRLPAFELVGGCEPVACSVYAG